MGFLTLTAAAQDAPSPPPVLDDQQLLRKYVVSTLGVPGALHATFASGLEQWRHSPRTWDMTASGYAKRWASEYAESAIGNTAKYAVAAALHHDPSFTRCTCTAVLRRLAHALSSPMLARDEDGRTVFSPATFAGLAAENVVPAATWYPAPRGVHDGLRHAAAGAIAKAGVDVFREFVSFPARRQNPHYFAVKQ